MTPPTEGGAPAPPSRVVRCKGPTCDARVRWVRTTKGKLMPLDAEPNSDPRANVSIEDGVAVVHAQPPMGIDELYAPHHMTCPDAHLFRKGTKT